MRTQRLRTVLAFTAVGSAIAVTAGALSLLLPTGNGDAVGLGRSTDATAVTDDASTSENTASVDTSALPAPLADVVEWAADLYEEAELELPPLRFEHHPDDRERCGGWMGVHQSDGDRSVIGLCVAEPTPQVEWLVLHEIAHAWTTLSLTDERREAFRELRGWEGWRTEEWHESGSEQAAEILAWGLIDRAVGVVTITDTSCDALDAGYRTLTGRAPLHGYRVHC